MLTGLKAYPVMMSRLIISRLRLSRSVIMNLVQMVALKAGMRRLQFML